MEEKIILVIIASITSLIVSVISLVNSVINGKIANKNVKETERFKYELELKMEEHQVIKDLFLKRLESIVKMISLIQQMKDLLLNILANKKDTSDLNKITSKISILKEDFFKAFQDASSILIGVAYSSAHDAKNLSLQIENYIVEINNKETINTDALNTRIEDFRILLDNYQNALIEIKESYISKGFKNDMHSVETFERGKKKFS